MFQTDDKSIPMSPFISLRTCEPVEQILRACRDFRRPVARLFKSVNNNQQQKEQENAIKAGVKQHFVKASVFCQCRGSFFQSGGEDFWQRLNQTAQSYRCGN